MFVLKQIQTEIKAEITILKRQKGTDVVKTKVDAAKKLMTDEELNDLLSETNSYMVEVLKDTETDKHLHYSTSVILKIRNALMASATLRIGRRSMEITKMTLEEVINQIVDVIDGKKCSGTKKHCFWKASSGCFNEVEYKLLTIFIRDLRPKILQDRYCKIVFPALSKNN